MSEIIQIFSYYKMHIHDGTAHSVYSVKYGTSCPFFTIAVSIEYFRLRYVCPITNVFCHYIKTANSEVDLLCMVI